MIIAIISFDCNINKLIVHIRGLFSKSLPNTCNFLNYLYVNFILGVNEAYGLYFVYAKFRQKLLVTMKTVVAMVIPG